MSRVGIDTVPLWRVRGRIALARWLLGALACAGLAASGRMALAPPRPAAVVRTVDVQGGDPAAAGFAELFARSYLTYDASRPWRHQAALAPFLGSSADPDAGLRLPVRGEATVLWTAVAGVAAHVYTVAAQMDSGALVYLDVDVARDPAGRLYVARYPAFVGPPSSRGADSLAGEGAPDVSDASLAAVVRRALTNYLSGSLTNLAADIAPGAAVAPPPNRLFADAFAALRRTGSASVLAVVSAHDASGAAYLLSYAVRVVRAADRWEVAQIESNPGDVQR
jgi:hypothetical protein